MAESDAQAFFKRGGFVAVVLAIVREPRAGCVNYVLCPLGELRLDLPQIVFNYVPEKAQALPVVSHWGDW